jgi:hypothetical protein
MVASLERLDALVFTGGIGENSTLVRSLVLGRLASPARPKTLPPTRGTAATPAGASAVPGPPWRWSCRPMRSC